MKHKNIYFALNAATLLVALGSTSAMAAVCNDVKFYANNTLDTEIRIYRVRYRDLDDGNLNAVHTENLPNFTCPKGDDGGNLCASDDPQDLGSVFEPRENHELDEIQYEYALWDERNGRWGDRDWSSPNTPSNKTCIDDKHYGDGKGNEFDIP